jgi:hypothetical protein
MRRIRTGALCAASFALLAGNASAVPIYFDFSGTITQAYGSMSGLEGVTISGGLTFETDNLTPMESPDLAMSQFYENDVSGAYGFLDFGSRHVSFPTYPQANTRNIVFQDTACPDYILHCSAAFADQFNLFARSSDVPFETSGSPDFIGTSHDSYVYVTSLYFEDLIDWTKVQPTDILSLPLTNVNGNYSDVTSNCSGGGALCTQDRNEFSFSIDAVTRGIGPRDVPEPDTLALAVAAAIGLLWMARRARDAKPNCITSAWDGPLRARADG